MAQIYRLSLEEAKPLLAGASCAFGVFDGVHTGHRFLLDAACETALEHGGDSVALTFDIDPDELFRDEGLKKLLSNEDRIEMLAASGVDAVCVLPFTRDFAACEPLRFLQLCFAGNMPAYLHVGSDFRYGAKASGTVESLLSWAAGAGVSLCAHKLLEESGEAVTSTRIRALLGRGKVQEAAALLGYNYTLHQEVHPGRGEGAGMGFATANLQIEPALQVLAEGVYACYARVGGKRYKAAASMGASPYFGEAAKADCEVHILDFSGDLYGECIYVEFVRRLRPMMNFPSQEALIETVRENIAWVRDNL